MTTVELFAGDNRISLRQLIAAGVQVHSVVTDAPYGLRSITKRFGKDGSKPAQFGKDGAFARTGAGFMGSKWDGTGIENDPEFWSLIHDILLPGGYLLAFSSPRTGHRMACAIEDAGFIIHPFIGWAYGQGFPKAHNAARAIDQALNIEGETVPAGDPVRRLRPGNDQNKDGSWEKLEDRVYQPGSYAPGSEEAAAWMGWAYGAQARKPALEPIYVAQKPFSEKNGALNILKHGVGAVNIDACRIGLRSLGAINPVEGRWPANLIHDGSAEVIAQFPESKCAAAPVKGSEPSTTGDDNTNCYGKYGRVPGVFYGDQEGSAARFFETYPFDDQTIFYNGKATKADRNGSRHPTVKPIALMRALIRHVTPPGGTVLDPFAGSGTTGSAALAEGVHCILMEAEQQFVADINQRFNLTDPFMALLEMEPAQDYEALLS